MPVSKKKPAASPDVAAAAAGGAATAAKPADKLADKLARLGLHTDMDLVLHLPLRYEDETQIMPIVEAGFMFGRPAQVEGIVTACTVQFRPRRQLVVTIADDSGPLVMRFLNFYSSQTKQMAEGNRVRARGEVRMGFFGAEMVHPTYKIVLEGAPLPSVLTPIYPAGEGISQTILRRVIVDAMKRVDWTDTLSAELRARLQLEPFEQSVRLLHNPPQDIDEAALIERSHPAWTRMKFDELLAQQLSLKRAQLARRAKGAAALPKVGRLSKAFLATLPFKLTAAQKRVLEDPGKLSGRPVLTQI